MAKPTRVSMAEDTVYITGFDKPFHVCLQASGGLERTCKVQHSALWHPAL